MRNHKNETERNYKKDIENLLRDIEVLELQKQVKETQLQRVQRDCKQNEQKKKATQAVDESGRAIHIGDRVIANTTTWKFKEKSGIVTNIKKWVTFTDTNGVKQTRALTYLQVEDA